MGIGWFVGLQTVLEHYPANPKLALNVKRKLQSSHKATFPPSPCSYATFPHRSASCPGAGEFSGDFLPPRLQISSSGGVISSKITSQSASEADASRYNRGQLRGATYAPRYHVVLSE